METHSSILAWRIPWTEKSLVGYSPWGRKESDMTERLSLIHSLIDISPCKSVSEFWRWKWLRNNLGLSAKYILGTSLMVQWLRLYTSSAEGMGSIPGGRSSTCSGQKKKKGTEYIYSILEGNPCVAFYVATDSEFGIQRK